MTSDRPAALFWEKEARKFHPRLEGCEPRIPTGLEFFRSIHIPANWAVPGSPATWVRPVFLGRSETCLPRHRCTGPGRVPATC